MSEEVKVKVHSYGSGRALSLVYIDPVTGKKVAKSSGTTDWREAERLAGELEKELQSGRFVAPSKITWEEFTTRYTAEKVASLSKGSQANIPVSLRLLARVVNPDRLSKMTSAVVSQFQSKLRLKGMKETTIAGHLRNIRAALRWAATMGLLPKPPKIEMPKIPKGQTLMKGRPITGEEFDRMLAEVPGERPNDADDWQRFLNGLWLSGLRLGEGCSLSWDEEAPFSVDLSAKRPVFRIMAAAQKARRDELLPMTPDFAQWLLETFPAAERVGKVFKLTAERGGQPLTAEQVGKVISAIGEAAKIVVNKAEGKFASAHDLRRAFGTRWAKKVMPAILQRLMRHADIGTTMKYYVSTSAAEVAEDLWAQFGGNEGEKGASGNKTGNICPETGTPEERSNRRNVKSSN